MIKKLTLNNIYVFISIIILIVGGLISLVSMSVNAQADISQNTEKIIHIETDFDAAKIIVLNNKDRLSKIETHYDHIKNQLDRIESKIGK